MYICRPQSELTEFHVILRYENSEFVTAHYQSANFVNQKEKSYVNKSRLILLAGTKAML